MKKTEFQTAACKLIASNGVKSTVLRNMLIKLAANGECRPAYRQGRSTCDYTHEVTGILTAIGVPECMPSKNGNYFRKGWYVVNDAPRGGVTGNILKINFEF